jgi:hypothetical protein
MRIRTQYLGRSQPFERDRRLVLRRLPVGAVVSRAYLVLRPYSVDTDGHFLETLSFPGASGDWGATKRVLSGAVEVDLRARRRLASLRSSNLINAHLLVDIGGGFMTVSSDGGIGGTPPLELSGTAPQLPGLVVTGLRVPQSADINALQVASPPSDVTVAIEGGPVFFSHFGDLVDATTTPDFGALLQGLLPNQPVVDGVAELAFVVHSGSIARLDIELAIDYTVAVSAMPDGVTSVATSYAYDGVPADPHGALTLALPPGSAAVSGASSGRAQGSFETSQVVFGDALGTPAPESVVLDATGPLAQPFVLPTTTVASSVDLLATAVTADVTVAVDIVDDLDGKPGRTSLLPRVAELTFTRDRAGSATWLNVRLPRELELDAADRRWLVLQARTGTALWGAGAGVAGDPGLQRTDDGGLSWRAVHGDTVPGPIKAQLRLRHATTAFHMPLELRAAAGGTETAVSLQRLAAQGAVDISLDIPEVADAVNSSAQASGATGSAAEAVANGDFVDWYRVGTTARERGNLHSANANTEDDPRPIIDAAIGFAPDSTTAYAAGRDGDTMRFLSFDVFSRAPVLDVPIGPDAEPLSLAVDSAGRHAVVSVAGSAFSPAAGPLTLNGLLTVIDTATGRPLGSPVGAPVVATRVVAAPDGTGVYLLGRDAADDTAVVRFVSWSDLLDAAGGAELDWSAYPAASLAGDPLALAVGSDGRVVTLTQPATLANGVTPDPVVSVFTTLENSPQRQSVPDAVDVAATADGVLVLTRAAVLFGDSGGNLSPRSVSLGGTPDDAVIAVLQTGDIAVVVRGASVFVIDIGRRTLVDDSGTSIEDTPLGATLAVNAAGTHGLVARPRGRDVTLLSIGDALPVDWQLTTGSIEPECLPGTTDVVAVLGRPTVTASAVASKRDPVTTALSQIVPTTGGAAYRFAFDGLSLFDGAVGEVMWRGADCVTARTDRVPITVIDPAFRESADRLAHHRLDLVAPAGAAQAEVRFFVPDGLAAIDKVSLAGSDDALGPSWTTSGPGTTVADTDAGMTITNGSAAQSTVAQLVQAAPGNVFDIAISARVPAGQDGTSIELAFSDEQARPLQPVVQLELDPLEFDDRSASGVVPAGAVAAEFRVVIPPGGSVEIKAVHLSIRPAATVGLHFVSDAPGELAMTNVSVVVDDAGPVTAIVPGRGLCRPTPAADEDDDDCYCCACGESHPAGPEVAATTDAGRPAGVSPCPTCGSSRVRLGGRVVAHAGPVSLPRFRATSAAAARRLADRSAPVPLEVIAGIGAARAAQLRTFGIPDGASLAQADVATVARLRGLSDSGAVRLIAAATREVRDRRPQTLFDQ